MAKRKPYTNPNGAKLAAKQALESNYLALGNMLKHKGLTVFSAKGETNAIILQGANLVPYTLDTIRKDETATGIAEGSSASYDETLKGTFVTLTFQDGLELTHCFVEATLPAYGLCKRYTKANNLKTESQSKASALLSTLHDVQRVTVFNPSVLPLKLARSKGDVWLNASLYFETGGVEYMLLNVHIRLDVALCTDLVREWESAKADRKPTAQNNAARDSFKANKASELDES